MKHMIEDFDEILSLVDALKVKVTNESTLKNGYIEPHDAQIVASLVDLYSQCKAIRERQLAV